MSFRHARGHTTSHEPTHNRNWQQTDVTTTDVLLTRVPYRHAHSPPDIVATKPTTSRAQPVVFRKCCVCDMAAPIGCAHPPTTNVQATDCANEPSDGHPTTCDRDRNNVGMRDRDEETTACENPNTVANAVM